eukprot:11110152-Heterocapsa_arctica.AAC.1
MRLQRREREEQWCGYYAVNGRSCTRYLRLGTVELLACRMPPWPTRLVSADAHSKYRLRAPWASILEDRGGVLV